MCHAQVARAITTTRQLRAGPAVSAEADTAKDGDGCGEDGASGVGDGAGGGGCECWLSVSSSEEVGGVCSYIHP